MTSGEIQPEVGLSQLQRVLESLGFVRNERMSRFLRFVVQCHLEGRDAELKESLIGIEVFGRKPGFDPQQDSIVRSEAARLRARLAEYYAIEGKSDSLVIELPKGGYAPRFRKAEPHRPAANLSRLRIAALAGLGGVVAIGGWWHFQREHAPIPIAVLPLTNVSQNAADDYFADGLTSEIISDLSMIDGLEVRSQTSSFALKSQPRNVREAGRELNAEYLLEGSVALSGQQLRINVQLVRSRDDVPIWSGKFDRKSMDVLSIQDEISRGIVNGLRLKLGRGRRRYETSVESYDLYLRARGLAARIFPGDPEVTAEFEKAIAKDPSLAPAWAGLAAALAWRTGERASGPGRDEELERMQEASEKAIQLDPLLAEAQTALGTVYARNAQWDAANRSFRRAIEIDANFSLAHESLARFYLWPLGKIDEAVREMR